MEAARIVLEEAQRPLSYDEIVQSAVEMGTLVPRGKTPGDSMRARLSEELRQNGDRSWLQRTSQNRFGLRDWSLPEYFATPFEKTLPSETVVALPRRLAESPTFGFTTNTGALLKTLGQGEDTVLLPRAAAETTTDFRQLVSYILLRSTSGDILSYVRGTYSAAPDLIKGRRCIGFGGHVLDLDRDTLFGRLDSGVSFCAYREIAEELKGVSPTSLQVIGAIWDDSSLEGMRHLGVVLEGRLPSSFEAATLSTELSVAGVRLHDPDDLWTRYHEFEFWSQLLIKNLFPSDKPTRLTKVLPSRRPKSVSALAVIGEIACGKTLLCDTLRDKHGFSVVPTRSCVSKLTGVPDFGTQDRTAFQEAAKRLVASPGGTDRLAREIAKRCNSGTRPALIDGVRNLGTLQRLRELLPSLMVIYVDAPRDLAVDNYFIRSGNRAAIEEFARAREHPVEKEVQGLRYEADAVLFNCGSRGELAKAFLRWWNQ